MYITVLLIYIFLAYLIGSLTFATVISRWMRLPDPRSYGSRNPGATNMLRGGNKKAAILTLVGDLVKGFLTISLVQFTMIQFGLRDELVAVSAVAVVVGHIWPLYYRFRGGKGVATAAGVLLALNIWMGLVLILVWLAVATISKISSLAALSAILLAPVAAWFILTHRVDQIAVSVIALILLGRHHTNIRSLFFGQERRIGEKKEI